jgi:hypothetical protein
VLIALVLTALVNAVGSALALVRTAVAHRRRAADIQSK